MFLSTVLSPTLARSENLALRLFTLGVRMPDIKKKPNKSANFAFVLDWHVWCELQQVGPKKLTTPANYLIFLSFAISEGLVSVMGGGPEWHVDPITHQHTHSPSNKISLPDYSIQTEATPCVLLATRVL